MKTIHSIYEIIEFLTNVGEISIGRRRASHASVKIFLILEIRVEKK